jgi:hypothetical protein
MVRRSVIVLAGLLLLWALTPAWAQQGERELAGVWRHQTQNGFTSELIIFPNGQYQKQDSQGGHVSLISGPIQKIPNPPTLRLNIKD